jgi:hypothetical protein
MQRLSLRTVLAIACALATCTCGSPRPRKSEREPGGAGASPSGVSRQRLFLEGHAEDDQARAERLAEIIRRDGARCEAAEKVAMVTSGIWTVRCREGAVYRVVFDRAGKLVETRKLGD